MERHIQQTVLFIQHKAVHAYQKMLWMKCVYSMCNNQRAQLMFGGYMTMVVLQCSFHIFYRCETIGLIVKYVYLHWPITEWKSKWRKASEYFFTKQNKNGKREELLIDILFCLQYLQYGETFVKTSN